MTKRFIATALTLACTAGLLAAGTSAGAQPAAPTRPGGLSRSQAAAQAATPTGDCAASGVSCKPGLAGSCTGFSSQSTPPATIRVYDPSYTGASGLAALHIRVVPFETYVENVLPNEWIDSWDGDALKAGAVAVTSYAWYWVSHYGGYVGATASVDDCFDVTHDTNFQKFVNGSALPNSTLKVQQVFPHAIRRNGTVIQASYLAALNPRYTDQNRVPDTTCGEEANGTTLSQTGSQACNEATTAYKWPVILQRYYGTDIQLATTAQLRAPHDFQYLQRSTPATYSSGTWSIADGYPTTLHYGLKGDIAVVNTVGDGFARAGVYRPSNHTWYLANATGNGTATSFRFGLSGDVPVAAQYRGIAAATQVAVWRPSNGTWYLAGPHGGTAATIQYGLRGDQPVPGRWTSSSTDTPAVYRVSTRRWYRRGIAGSVQYGLKGDIPAPADYTGDGRTDIAVYRPSTRMFYVRGQAAVHWGLAGDVPVTGDFTGDGRADLAVYRPSTHTLYVRSGPTVVLTPGSPIGAAPYHQ